MVTWGNPGYGGDSSRVQHQLKNVQQICSTYGAFAAILAGWKRGDVGLLHTRVVTAPESNMRSRTPRESTPMS